MRVSGGPGRSCPVSYAYSPTVFARPADLSVDCVWIVGGLYGNPFALEALLKRFDSDGDSKVLAFNGDFHWFDADPLDFEAINETVLSFHAMRGNVETELARPTPETGCGCGYPGWVDDATVARSNRILSRLRRAAQDLPDGTRRLARLPTHMRADVGGIRVGIVHGDASALAGWSFSQETLATAAGEAAALNVFDRANVHVFASSHTCLPVLQDFGGNRVLVNNGAAGMPNFRGELFGLATRIAVWPAEDSLYGMRVGGVYIDAIPLRYDHAAWVRRFLAQWPAGSDAHVSYYTRIVEGPAYDTTQAVRVKCRRPVATGPTRPGIGDKSRD